MVAIIACGGGKRDGVGATAHRDVVVRSHRQRHSDNGRHLERACGRCRHLPCSAATSRPRRRLSVCVRDLSFAALWASRRTACMGEFAMCHRVTARKGPVCSCWRPPRACVCDFSSCRRWGMCTEAPRQMRMQASSSRGLSRRLGALGVASASYPTQDPSLELHPAGRSPRHSGKPACPRKAWHFNSDPPRIGVLFETVRPAVPIQSDCSGPRVRAGLS